MNKLFHLTISQGRADTLYLYSLSKTKLLNFFNTVCTGVVRNIKEVVYSQKYNINYVEKAPFKEGAVYSKVVIVASTKNYSDTLVFFNVPKALTQEQIKQQCKKLFIKDEPITDFLDIQLYNEGDSPIYIDNLYQVQYKRHSKTHTEDFYSDSWQKVYNVAEALIDGEITEIRKFIHYDGTFKKDDSTKYTKRIAINISSSDSSYSLSIPKVSKKIDLFQFKELLKECITLRFKKIDNEEITLTYR